MSRYCVHEELSPVVGADSVIPPSFSVVSVHFTAYVYTDHWSLSYRGDRAASISVVIWSNELSPISSHWS